MSSISRLPINKYGCLHQRGTCTWTIYVLLVAKLMLRIVMIIWHHMMSALSNKLPYFLKILPWSDFISSPWSVWWCLHAASIISNAQYVHCIMYVLYCSQPFTMWQDFESSVYWETWLKYIWQHIKYGENLKCSELFEAIWCIPSKCPHRTNSKLHVHV